MRPSQIFTIFCLAVGIGPSFALRSRFTRGHPVPNSRDGDPAREQELLRQSLMAAIRRKGLDPLFANGNHVPSYEWMEEQKQWKMNPPPGTQTIGSYRSKEDTYDGVNPPKHSGI
ncbi:hypothetical protein F5148DRAFT_1154604 [Russula earlei]|uniref:Uncharacterized protein n=1 Tax=Russula earlei TaxID=71964 RepID=A0ACC0TS09_9AGAM|nr:hypothetical protein F5148DRAFT_1154604 [Russula earlei]